MIQRLRTKFVAINMALVGAVLCIVFLLIILTNVQQQRQATDAAMHMAIERDAGAPPNRFVIGLHKPPDSENRMFPVFSVIVTPDGSVESLNPDFMEIDEDLVEQAVAHVLAQEAETGVIRALSLRFLVREMPDGAIRIAFADQTGEIASLRQLILTLLLVGVLALLAFFFISLFLARWVLRPVERAWAQQQRFVADASHELKTPLTVVLANLDILRKNPDHTIGQEERWLENTQAEATRMKQLVEDLLFLAKSDAEQGHMPHTRFSISDALYSILLPFEPVAFEKGVTLLSDIHPDLEMDGDIAQIKQLAVILLDNACKFAGEKGTVWVTLSPEHDRIRLTVTNTGQTIGEKDMPHIFERFYRTDQARARTAGGYGLGLSIAAQITRAHHGRIAVTSDAVQGTQFSVVLPRA